MQKYLKGILLTSFILLALGQFDLDFFGRPMLMVASLGAAALYFFQKPKFQNDLFFFVMVIFVLSHFDMHKTVASFAGFLAFLGIFKLWFMKKRFYELPFFDEKIKMYIFVLVLFNVLGWIFRSHLRIHYMVMAVVGFISLIIMFQVSRRLRMNSDRISIIVNLIALLSMYALFTALANGMYLIPFKSPIFGGAMYLAKDNAISYEQSNIYGAVSKVFLSMIGRPTGEMGLIYFSFLFTIYIYYERVKDKIKINKWILLGGVISSFIVCLIEFSKSHTIGLFLSVLFTSFLSGYFIRTDGVMSITKMVKLAAIIIPLMILTQSKVRYDYIIERFALQPKMVQNLMENPLTAEGTSRSDSWGLAFKYISENSFVVGYGYANGTKNRIAWLGPENQDYPKLDYHNFIYSLIPVFGWLGTIAYLAIIFLAMKRLLKVSSTANIMLYYRVVSFAFFNLLLFFMFGELTINAMSSSHYMMLLMLVLGLSHALYYNRLKFLYKPD